MNMELVLVPDSLVLHAIMHIPSTHLFRWQYSPVVCPFQNIDAFKYAYRTVYKCRYYVKDVIHVCKLLEPTSQGSCRCQVAIRAQGSPCHWKCHRSYGASSSSFEIALANHRCWTPSWEGSRMTGGTTCTKTLDVFVMDFCYPQIRKHTAMIYYQTCSSQTKTTFKVCLTVWIVSGWSFPTRPAECQTLPESKGRIFRSNQKIHTQEHQDEPERCTIMDYGNDPKKWSLGESSSHVIRNPPNSIILVSWYPVPSAWKFGLKGAPKRWCVSCFLRGTCYWSPDPSVVLQKVEESKSPRRRRNVPSNV